MPLPKLNHCYLGFFYMQVSAVFDGPSYAPQLSRRSRLFPEGQQRPAANKALYWLLCPRGLMTKHISVAHHVSKAS